MLTPWQLFNRQVQSFQELESSCFSPDSLLTYIRRLMDLIQFLKHVPPPHLQVMSTFLPDQQIKNAQFRDCKNAVSQTM
jgi:hypothetical protein